MRYSALAILIAFATVAVAQPVSTPWPVAGPDDTVAAAAAPLAGWYATGDSYEDNVEIRDIRANLVSSISKAQIQALVPWMSLDGSVDGVCSLAMSDTGRLLFVLVFDSNPAGDGQPSDAILRLDVSTGALTLFARLELSSDTGQFQRIGAAYFKGRLYVGSALGATVRVYNAASNQAAGSLAGSTTLPGGGIRAIAVDRENGVIYAANELGVYRASAATLPLSFVPVGALTGVRGLTWATQYGPASGALTGLFVLRDGAGGGSEIDFVSAAQAAGSTPFAPAVYATTPGVWHALSATADGALLVGADEDGVMLRDASDTRLSFDGWVADEFAQHVAIAKGLISPDGEPAGWVIDADVVPGASRFHPATPDAAGWTVLMLLASDEVNADAEALPKIRTVLTRYAGLAGDGIWPSRTTDGIFRHWIDPLTGNAKPGWDPEYATLSTMKIVLAAARAWQRYPDDPVVVRAASRIIFGVKNWGAYFQGGSQALFFKGNAGGGPDTSVAGVPFNEGILFTEQASALGQAGPYALWINRGLWPVAYYLIGRPITGGSSGSFQAAFLSLYPLLLQGDYRTSADWQAQVENLRWSSAAWTDDNAPQFYTVFSAGTTASQWGGYNADSLGYHPGDVTTFTSLEAMCSQTGTPEAVGAYQAYRRGAREAFKTGANLLYRRSNVDRAYTPNSAGLPDVTLGGLGLGEILRPGLAADVLTGPYPRADSCPVDVNGDGSIGIDDVYQGTAAPVDLNADGVGDAKDARCIGTWVRRHEAEHLGTQW